MIWYSINSRRCWFLKNSPNNPSVCFDSSWAQVDARFWGNTPLNLDSDAYEAGDVKLQSWNLKNRFYLYIQFLEQKR